MNLIKKILVVMVTTTMLVVNFAIPTSALENDFVTQQVKNSESAKFEIISQKIDLILEEHKAISYEETLNLMSDINIDKFNDETDDSYKNIEHLARDVFNNIESYLFDLSSMMTTNSITPIYENGLNNYTKSGWNYNGIYKNRAGTNDYNLTVKKAYSNLIHGGAITAAITTLLQWHVGTAITAVVVGSNANVLNKLSLDLDYYNGPRGTYITSDKFIKKHTVRAQHGGCAYNCAPGGGGGGGR